MQACKIQLSRLLGFSCVCLALMLSSLSQAEEARDSTLEQLTLLLNSSFATRDSDAENTILDRRVRLISKNLTGVWLYHQLNTGENLTVYRQRILNLIETENGVRQITYTPSDLNKWEDAWEKPELLENLDANDFTPSFDVGCDLIWTKLGESYWRGYVDPKLCRYFSIRRDTDIYIESESIVSLATLLQAERGFDAQGKQLWGSKPGNYISLKRTSKQ